ncbi:hypothetical protein ACFOY2_26965 [Nonomuraea purpurea]|uniref:Transposase n=1 Tax=Nonomuraea purpurea TaxID=1849276 RepID=A0ABV8GDZ3_9ACTN
MVKTGQKSRREEILECLAGFPKGATVAEVCAYFDYVRSPDYMRHWLRKLVGEGLIVRIDPEATGGCVGNSGPAPMGRLKYRLAAEEVVSDG